jgi:hypothetical protein
MLTNLNALPRSRSNFDNGPVGFTCRSHFNTLRVFVICVPKRIFVIGMSQ